MNIHSLIHAALAMSLSAAAVISHAADARNVFDTEAGLRLPPAVSAPGLSLAQTRQDLLMARDEGRVNLFDNLSDLRPYGADGMSTKTRQQVVAETLEAIRLGAISRREKNSFPTAEQLDRIHMAGLQALPMEMAAR